MRSTRLSIETLENRTVLSANFGVDFESQAFREFNPPPPPRVLADYEALMTAIAAFAEDAKMKAPDIAASGYVEGAFPALIIEIHIERHQTNETWGGGKPPLRLRAVDDRPPQDATASSDEEGLLASSNSYEKGPLKSQAPPLLNSFAGAVGNSIDHDGLADLFDPPQAPNVETWLERLAEARHVATSPFVIPVNELSPDEAETVASASLLAAYATLAASIDDASPTASHDAAFAGYSTLRDEDQERQGYLQLLAEDQTGDTAEAEASGFADLNEARLQGVDELSNLAADAQRESIERALRSLAARRGNSRAALQPENWLEQAWLSADAARQGEGSVNQLADEPGGMILLQPMTADAGDELIAASDVSEVIKTAVEMEATIGAFQAFDVSIDEAPASIVKPAPAGELGAKQDRDASEPAEARGQQAASGLGALAVGALAFAAKRQLNDRRRKPQ